MFHVWCVSWLYVCDEHQLPLLYVRVESYLAVGNKKYMRSWFHYLAIFHFSIFHLSRRYQCMTITEYSPQNTIFWIEFFRKYHWTGIESINTRHDKISAFNKSRHVFRGQVRGGEMCDWQRRLNKPENFSHSLQNKNIKYL